MTIKPGGVIAVDFDGVINSYQTRGADLIDPPEPGALEFINYLIELGLDPVVFTTRARTPKGTLAVEDWLEHYGFPKMRVTHEKFAALAYVDDRACPYIPRSGDWGSVMDRIEALTELNSQRGIPDGVITRQLTDTNA